MNGSRGSLRSWGSRHGTPRGRNRSGRRHCSDGRVDPGASKALDRPPMGRPHERAGQGKRPGPWPYTTARICIGRRESGPRRRHAEAASPARTGAVRPLANHTPVSLGASTGEGTPGQRCTRLPRPIAPPRKAGHRISARARRGARPTGCVWQRCVQGRLPAPKANASFPTEKLTANHERDERVQAQLRSFGWDVMVAWEHELRARYPGRGGGPARRARGTAWAETGSGRPSAPQHFKGQGARRVCLDRPPDPPEPPGAGRCGGRRSEGLRLTSRVGRTQPRDPLAHRLCPRRVEQPGASGDAPHRLRLAAGRAIAEDDHVVGPRLVREDVDPDPPSNDSAAVPDRDGPDRIERRHVPSPVVSHGALQARLSGLPCAQSRVRQGQGVADQPASVGGRCPVSSKCPPVVSPKCPSASHRNVRPSHSASCAVRVWLARAQPKARLDDAQSSNPSPKGVAESPFGPTGDHLLSPRFGGPLADRLDGQAHNERVVPEANVIWDRVAASSRPAD